MALYAIYQCHPEHVVLRIDGNSILEQYRTPVPGGGCGPVHGGTIPLPRADHWLRFAHYRADTGLKPTPWRYYVAALTMEPRPPFAIIKVAPHPVLSASEGINLNKVSHFKSNVVFPCGVIDAGLNYWLSFGRNDCENCIAQIPKDQIGV